MSTLGRVAVVTGATSGIGRVIAERLLRRGWTVVLVGRRAQRLAEVADAAGGTAVPLAIDVRDEDAGERMLAALPAAVDRLVLVNAAGESGPIGPAGAIDVPWWRSAFATNVFAPVALTETLLPVMMRAGWGRVVNVSSASAFHRRRRSCRPTPPARSPSTGTRAAWPSS